MTLRGEIATWLLDKAERLHRGTLERIEGDQSEEATETRRYINATRREAAEVRQRIHREDER